MGVLWLDPISSWASFEARVSRASPLILHVGLSCQGWQRNFPQHEIFNYAIIREYSCAINRQFYIKSNSIGLSLINSIN